jgi:type IV secretion system protein VirB10
MRLMVTADVVDKFQSGLVLIPQYSYLHGQQTDGGVQYGQTRLGMTLEGLEFPDGTYLVLGKAKAGNQSGAVGLTGSVNNHWVQVGVSAVLTAALSIGSRAPFGSPSGLQQNLPQEFAQDAGSSVNRSGQQIVQRSLSVHPTITLAHGTAVTVQLLDNISLQTPPVITNR